MSFFKRESLVNFEGQKNNSRHETRGIDIESDSTSKKVGEILIDSGHILLEEDITRLLRKQSSLKSSGIDIIFGDLLVRNRIIKRYSLIKLLESSGISLRLGEMLYLSNKISLDILDKALLIYYEEHKKGNTFVTFGDVLVKHFAFSRNELIIFLKEIKVRLKVGEILLLKGLISEEKLYSTLLNQNNSKRKKLKLLEFFYKIIDEEEVASILLAQKLSSKDYCEFGIKIEECEMSEEEFCKNFLRKNKRKLLFGSDVEAYIYELFSHNEQDALIDELTVSDQEFKQLFPYLNNDLSEALSSEELNIIEIPDSEFNKLFFKKN